MPSFIPKNFLSASTDSLNKRLPTAMITEENVNQNAVQIIKQLKKEIESLHAAYKSGNDSNAAAVEGINQRINNVAGNLERAIELLRQGMPDGSDMVSQAEFQAFLQNIMDFVSIDPEYIEEMAGFAPFMETRPDWEGNGYDFNLAEADSFTLDENLATELSPDYSWVPSLNITGGPINAKDGLNVSQGLDADTATISGIFSLGAIGDVEQCLGGLQAQIDDLISVPAPPDDANDYQLQSIAGVLTWVPV